MRTQYLHDTVYDNTYAARVTSATSEGVYSQVGSNSRILLKFFIVFLNLNF